MIYIERFLTVKLVLKQIMFDGLIDRTINIRKKYTGNTGTGMNIDSPNIELMADFQVDVACRYNVRLAQIPLFDSRIFLPDYQYVHIGGKYIDGGWQWLASEMDIEYTNWATNEPATSYGINYHCLAMFSGKWYAVQCFDYYQFVCQIPL